MRGFRLAGLGFLTLLGACGETSVTRPALNLPPPPRQPVPTGLERVIGKDVRALQILFGEPDLDVREPPARKLQYASSICVLDAYLYPPAPGREPIVKYIDARQPTGEDFDRASCIAALSRRREAR